MRNLKDTIKYFESIRVLNSKYPDCVKLSGDEMEINLSKFKAHISTDIISNNELPVKIRRELLNKIRH